MNEWFIFFVANFILKIRWTYIIFRFWHCLSNNENTFLLFDYSNKYSFYHLFIFSRCSRYHQIRLSEKWPSPERRSPREKLAGPNCRRNMYAYSILLNMIKYYFMYYINITNKNSILSLVIQAVMKVWTLQRKNVIESVGYKYFLFLQQWLLPSEPPKTAFDCLRLVLFSISFVYLTIASISV